MTETDALNENFAQLLFHLAQMVALYMGDLEGPNGERMEAHPEAAAQFIEILGMLQDKTKGNLSAAESKALDDLLYELRLRFLNAQKGGDGPRIIQP